MPETEDERLIRLSTVRNGALRLGNVEYRTAVLFSAGENEFIKINGRTYVKVGIEPYLLSDKEANRER